MTLKNTLLYQKVALKSRSLKTSAEGSSINKVIILLLSSCFSLRILHKLGLSPLFCTYNRVMAAAEAALISEGGFYIGISLQGFQHKLRACHGYLCTFHQLLNSLPNSARQLLVLVARSLPYVWSSSWGKFVFAPRTTTSFFSFFEDISFALG